jgi:hypothetical protein
VVGVTGFEPATPTSRRFTLVDGSCRISSESDQMEVGRCWRSTKHVRILKVPLIYWYDKTEGLLNISSGIVYCAVSESEDLDRNSEYPLDAAAR